MTFLRTQPVSTHFGHNKIMVKAVGGKTNEDVLID
jgi:hypothetical protein